MQPRSQKDPDPGREKLLRELEELLAMRLGTPNIDPEVEKKIDQVIKTLQQIWGG